MVMTMINSPDFLFGYFHRKWFFLQKNCKWRIASGWGNRINNLFQNPWFKEELALPWTFFLKLYDCYWIYTANTLLLNLFIFKGKKNFRWGLEVLSNLVEELSLNNTFLVFMCIFEALTTVRQTITRSTILKDSSSGRI